MHMQFLSFAFHYFVTFIITEVVNFFPIRTNIYHLFLTNFVISKNSPFSKNLK